MRLLVYACLPAYFRFNRNYPLIVLEVGAAEDTPVQIELGEDTRLTLPNKKRQVSSFFDWARCFATYSHYLCSHQPTDLMAYLYIIATCNTEYNFPACMAYDVTLSSTPRASQALARPATGLGVTTSSHPSSDCHLFPPEGPAKKARVSAAGPKHSSQAQGKEICRNYNRRKVLPE